MALAKYYEDNKRIAEERLRDKDEDGVKSLKPKNTSNTKTERVSSRKLRKLKKQKERENPFTPKKGIVDTLPHRNLVTISFNQYLYEEWCNVLRQNGWKWSHYNKYWYHKWDDGIYEFAIDFVYGKTTEVDIEPGNKPYYFLDNNDENSQKSVVADKNNKGL